MWIKNIRLETGYEECEGVIHKTKTELFDIEIEDEIIQSINKNAEIDDFIDGKGYLALPSLKDNHVHLDKGHFGGPWKAVIPMNSVAERIIEEEGFLVDFLEDTPQKAQSLIDLITSFGTTYLKVQVNIDPVIGLKNYRIVKEVLDNNSHKLEYDIVAFPQHGGLKTQSEGLLEEALNEGITILGGLDPATIDYDIEKSLKMSFDLAKKYGVSLDIHLHNPGTLGIYEIERLLYYTDLYEMANKVSISHGLSLGDLSPSECEKMARELKKRSIEIHSTQPVDRPALPFMKFIQNGVQVNIVNDNINDHWFPFGMGDLIEKLNTACQIHSIVDEYSLSRTLKAVTGGLTPLDDEGKQIWPKVGDPANIVFVKAESSAHLIARIVPERVTMFKGEIIKGKFI